MPKLNIYFLKRENDHVTYDEMQGCMVAAESENQARELANTACGDEGEIWDVIASSTGRYVSCNVIGTSNESEARVLMSDFLNG